MERRGNVPHSVPDLSQIRRAEENVLWYRRMNKLSAAFGAVSGGYIYLGATGEGIIPIVLGSIGEGISIGIGIWNRIQSRQDRRLLRSLK